MAWSFSAVYVRGASLAELRPRYPKAESLGSSEWVVSSFSKGATPPDDGVLRGTAFAIDDRTRLLPEVIYLFADSRPDSFVYEHWRSGELTRKLVWFSFGDAPPSWLYSSGAPEPWESELFRPAALERIVATEREEHQESGRPFGERDAEIHALWSRGHIITGGRIPPCDGTVAHLVERHFGIPHPA